MKYSVSGASVATLKADCIVAGVYESGELTAHAAALDKASGGVVARIIESGDVRGKPGETHSIPASEGPARRVILVGLGKAADLDLKQFRRALLAGAGAAARTAATSVTNLLALDPPASIDGASAARHSVECFAHATYRSDAFKSKSDEDGKSSLADCVIAVREGTEAEARASMAVGESIAAGVALARDLGNAPPNICTPTYLAQTAERIAGECDAMSCRILEQADIEKLGMGSFLSVTRGSRQPPKLVVLEYRGGNDGDAPVALVGKGITFDTGGICIKPAPNLDEMKYDMCGAAGVLGTMQSLARLQPALNVVAVVPCCENMPDGLASRPGDIVTAMDGQTIEILNTDAEGRLILCDAITYSRQFSPDVVVDVATLTGACVIALGAHYSGLMSNDDALADALCAAGEKASDVAWRLPMTEDYAEELKSNFADFANVGGRPGGAITAACFLHKFARDLRWAHLDIAGTAWKGGKQKGGTGRPVSMLMQFLLDRLS
jgi:leucyl aminopeptidase